MNASAPRELERRGSTLCVFVRCHGLLCSFSVSEVERLLLPEEVELRGTLGAGPVPAIVGKSVYAAWDFGSLLELPSLGSAYLVLHYADSRGTLPLLLRTGECVQVREVGGFTELPPALFKARHGAFASAFVPPAQKAKDGTLDVVALHVSVRHLFLPAEVDAARSLVDKHAGVRERL